MEMKNRWFVAAGPILFFTLSLGTPVVRAQDHHDDRQMHDHFDDHDRQAARDWYHSNPHVFRHDEGRYWHHEWEPNIHEGFVLTPDMRAGIRPLPHDLYVRFGPPPPGYRYVIIRDHVVLVDRGYRIHDVLHFEL